MAERRGDDRCSRHHGGNARSDRLRLEDQIEWYERRSAQAQRTYKRLKIVQIAVGAVIPFLAGIQEQPRAALAHELDLLPALLIAALGVIVVVLEDVHHLNQYQKTSLDYCSTTEALKHEKFLVLAGAGPYADVDDRRARLAERIEELIASEHSRWVAVRNPWRGSPARVSGRTLLRSGSAGS